MAGGVGIDGAEEEDEEAIGAGVGVAVWDVAVAPFCPDDQGEEAHPAAARPAANTNQSNNVDRSM